MSNLLAFVGALASVAGVAIWLLGFGLAAAGHPGLAPELASSAAQAVVAGLASLVGAALSHY